MHTFTPSQDYPVFHSSKFQNGEKECAAAYLVTLYAKLGLEWKQEVTYKQLTEYFQQEDNDQIHPAYAGMIAMFGRQVVQALRLLADENYLTIRQDGTEVYIGVTDKMVTEFYANYVTAAA